jgi:type IV pilus assembly protein PilQ
MTRNALVLTVSRLVCLAAGVGLAFPGGAWAQEGEPATQPGVSIDREGAVELHVQGADLRSVLQLLSTQSKTNIVATKAVTGTVTADLYGVTFVQALDAVLKSTGFRYAREDNFIYVMTEAEWKAWQADRVKMAVKVFKLSYITAADAQKLIAPAMSSDGTISVSPPAKAGIASSSDDAGGNDLAVEDVMVVKDYPENLEKVTAILRDVDVRPRQVLIEASIMAASLDEDNALGVDFNALAGVDFRSLSSTSTGLTGVTPGAVPAAQLDDAGATFRTDMLANFPPGGLTIGFISNNVAFFIRALESVTDTVVLANPKLLVMNKQRGEVLVGEKEGYLTTTITETAATQKVEFLETGTHLLIRPYIATDGYVRMEIHTKDSEGDVVITGELALPEESTTEVTSNVLVKDGHTIVIGGLFKETTTSGRSQIPLLGNLPVAGALFRMIDENTDRQEIIILLTPHIIKHPVDEVVSEQLKDDITRFRFGLRRGLMWFGRDRLANRHMRSARRHLAAGDREKALWNLNMALSVAPRMEEALRLKERLTKQAIWAEEARISNVGYVLQRMILQELGEPVEKVAVPYKPADGMKLRKQIRDALGIGPRPELPLEGPGETRSPGQNPTTRPAAGPAE